MATFESASLMYNPRNIKCRACAFYGENNVNGTSAVETCICTENKIQHRIRYHNSKACNWFKKAKFLE